MKHRPCHGCLDGCTHKSTVHCVSCVNEQWPCDASEFGRLLLGLSSEAHYHRKHPPYGSSFLDCEREPCSVHRAALAKQFDHIGDG